MGQAAEPLSRHNQALPQRWASRPLRLPPADVQRRASRSFDGLTGDFCTGTSTVFDAGRSFGCADAKRPAWSARRQFDKILRSVFRIRVSAKQQQAVRSGNECRPVLRYRPASRARTRAGLAGADRCPGRGGSNDPRDLVCEPCALFGLLNASQPLLARQVYFRIEYVICTNNCWPWRCGDQGQG